jgi:hypothetical protein
VTQKALVGIVAGAEAVGIGVELGEEGVQLSLAYTGDPIVTSAQVSQVDSNCPAQLIPSRKDANSLALIVAPVVGFGLITGG